jgi:hypothetical protein
MRLTGGCQCGAIRYHITEPPKRATLCHCRMCQKAMGGAYLASATVWPASFSWTRGQPASFASSSMAFREFCGQCGTPLAYRDLEGGRAVTLGSLDQPDAVAPGRQIGIESRLSWWRGDGLADGATTEEDAPDLALGLQNFQHPDHDTDDWVPHRG